MARPRLEPGTWGSISVTTDGDGYIARAHFRDFTGKSIKVQRSGRSKAAATNALTAELRNRATSGDEELRGTTPVSVLGAAWIAEMEQSKVTHQSVEEYRRAFTRHVEPGLGNLTIQEATTGRLDRFLKGVADKTPATAKQCRVVLKGMFDMARRRDVIAHNPVDGTKLPAAPKKEPRALTLDEVRSLRRGVYLWQTAPNKSGPRRTQELLDVIDVFLGTGMRIGELCALRWDDVDLGDVPTVTVSGTVVNVKGQCLIRQEHPKTAESRRTIPVPGFVVEVLLRRQVEGVPNVHNVVFPSSTGTLWNPHNVRRVWREACKSAGFGWVTPHSLRKTVATLVHRAADVDTAAAVLGHSGTAVTMNHYVEKLHRAPDVTAVLEPLGSRGFLDQNGE